MGGRPNGSCLELTPTLDYRLIDPSCLELIEATKLYMRPGPCTNNTSYISS